MKLHQKWGLVFMAAALALVALVNGANALAEDTHCTGSLGAISVDNLYVPQSASCTLNGTIVKGNLFVEANATLHAYDVQVEGNIQADNANRVNVYAGSSVNGKIGILHSGAADIQSVDIDSDLYFDDNILFLNAADNTIGGNFQAFKNTGGVSITGNTIGGNLQCNENSPAPTGAGNSVGGNMEGQCIGFGEEPSPVPTNTSLPPTSTPPAPTNTPPSQTSTAQAPDQEAPTVIWIAPVSAGERYNIHEGEQVSLEVEASDNGGVHQVRFLRWDAVSEQYITLGILVQPPFRIMVSASDLNPGWNQVFVNVSDLAGNNSGYTYIWLYKIVQGQSGSRVYLPLLGK